MKCLKNLTRLVVSILGLHAAIGDLAPAVAIPATDVTVVPGGNLQSTDAQSALDELSTEKDHNVLYVEDFAVLYPSSTTGGINETIAACSPPGFGARLGCRIVLPRGTVEISETIQIGGLTPFTARSGIVLQGHASGLETTSPPDLQMAGTVIRWDGAQGGTMLRVAGTTHFRLQDFNLDGTIGAGAAAGVGIELVGENEPGGAVTHGGLVENIVITGIKDPDPDMYAAPHSGFGIWIHGAGADPENDQVDEIKFVRVEVSDSTECIRTESTQALVNTWIGSTCGFARYGAGVENGSIGFYDSFFSQKTPTNLASIHVGPNAGYVNVRDCDFETIYGDTILTSDTGSPGYHLLIQGNAFLMLGDPNQGDANDNYAFVKVLAPKQVTLIGNSFLADSANTAIHADLTFNTTAGGGVKVFSGGNTKTSGRVHFNVGGTRGSAVSADSLVTSGDPLGASNALDLLQTALVFPGGESTIWRDGAGNDKFKLYYNSTMLRLLDGTNSAGVDFSVNPTSGNITVGANGTGSIQTRGGAGYVRSSNFRIYDSDQTNYLGFSTANRTSDYPVVWNLTGNCSAQSGGGKLTINAANEIVCAGDASGSSSNSFVTHNAPAGTDPVASSPTDTLNYVKGRSLSVTGDAAAKSLTVAADVELYTDVESFFLKAPTATDDGLIQVSFPTDVTVTRVWCSTKAGTVTIQFDERAEATPNTAGPVVMTSSLVCDNNSQVTTAFSNNSIAAHALMNMDISVISGTPGALRVFVEYTRND